ncbi:MAG: hypothetical protein V4521_02515 [Pseudomonadota bacterium]
MSRAMNISLPEAKVRAACEKAKVSVSVLETLPSGGTRLVCTREEGAEEMRVIFRTNMIEGNVKRYTFQRSQNSNYA